MTNNKIVWVEKYRPQKVEDCILPDRIKKPFLGYVKKGEFPNLLLSGGAGTGKTTIAKALCAELGFDVLVINASDERNIDVVRGKITSFASHSSMLGNKKAIILDEADGLNMSTAQPALKFAIEEFSDVRFILTCNYKNKLIAPLHSRTASVAFNVKKSERKQVASQFMQRVMGILEEEKIVADPKVVGAVISKFYPDNRRILNELQGYSCGTGEIDSGMLAVIDKASISSLAEACKDKDMGKVRQWVVDNIDTDPTELFHEIYLQFYTLLEPESVPEMIIANAEYQYKAAFVADHEVNMMAFLMVMIGSVAFK